ncbi:MAG: hypothetical protein ACWGSQ_15900 [Longimicrobiales bacterium]
MVPDLAWISPRTSALARGPVPLLLVVLLAFGATSARGQVPNDRAHLSVSLGGYVMVGIGITHWIEEHHALEATLYPFAFPGEGFPFAVKAGYAWIPSDEVWRAKLGGNFTLLVRKPAGGPRRLTPLVAFTPGLQYDPSDQRSFRADFWMSYYLTEKVFAPTALELLYNWK